MLGSSAEKIKILGPRIPKVIVLTTTTERQTNDYIEGIADERRHRLERSKVERANNSGLPPVLFARAVASPWRLVGWRKCSRTTAMSRWRRDGPMTRGRGGRAYPNPGIVAKFARDLQPGCQRSQLLGGGQHVAHHLDQASRDATSAIRSASSWASSKNGVSLSGSGGRSRRATARWSARACARWPCRSRTRQSTPGAVEDLRRRAARWLSLTLGNGSPYSLRPAR